jgi:hypothetical protein
MWLPPLTTLTAHLAARFLTECLLALARPPVQVGRLRCLVAEAKERERRLRTWAVSATCSFLGRAPIISECHAHHAMRPCFLFGAWLAR